MTDSVYETTKPEDFEAELHRSAEESRQEFGGESDSLPTREEEARALAEVLPSLQDGTLPPPTEVSFDSASLRIYYSHYRVSLERLPEKRNQRLWTVLWYPGGTFASVATEEFVFPDELEKISRCFTNFTTVGQES